MDSSVAPKDETWFLRVCHHISNAACNTLMISVYHRKWLSNANRTKEVDHAARAGEKKCAQNVG
jgi:hypothetical protein